MGHTYAHLPAQMIFILKACGLRHLMHRKHAQPWAAFDIVMTAPREKEHVLKVVNGS